MFNDLITSSTSRIEWECSLRSGIYQRITDTLGNKPDDDFSVVVKDTGSKFERQGHLINNFSMELLPGYHMNFYVMLPKKRTGELLPVAMAIHGTSDLGRNYTLEFERGFALDLLERGFAVIAPDLYGFGDWQKYFGSRDESFKQFYQQYPEWSIDGFYLYSLQKLIDWITGQAQFDSAHIAALGHSLGGRVALYLAALEPRIFSAAVSCGMSPNLTNLFRNLPGQTLEFSPELNREIVKNGLPPWEYHELLALAAPRRLLLIEPWNDNFNPLTEANFECFFKASKVWSLYGAKADFELLSHGLEHTVSRRVIEYAMDFCAGDCRATGGRAAS